METCFIKLQNGRGIEFDN